MFKICRILVVLILLTFIYFPCVNAQDKPEVFVQLWHSNWVNSVTFSPDGRLIASGSGDGTTRLWDAQNGHEVAMFVGFTDGEWVIMTPEGYYTASSGGEKYINVRIGNNVYSIENYRKAFYRPDLVKLAITGSSLKNYKTLDH